MEGVYDDYLRESLDTTAGIDFWLIHDGMEALASRVQGYRDGKSNGLDISTFSIRYSRDGTEHTELQKRTQAIEQNWQYPKYTVQAYVADIEWECTEDSKEIKNGRLLNAAYCLTKELVQYVNHGELSTHIGKNDSDERESFYYAHWLDYQLFNDIKVLKEPSKQSFAMPLLPTYDPVNGRPPQHQYSLIEFADD